MRIATFFSQSARNCLQSFILVQPKFAFYSSRSPIRRSINNANSGQIILILICIFFASDTAAKPLLRIGIYQNSPKVFSSDGQAQGFFIDVAREISSRASFEFEYVGCQWSDCLDMLVNNQLDIMPDVAFTDERAQIFKFGRQTVINSWSAVYSKNKFDIRSEFDLENRTIAVLKGSIQQTYLKDKLAKHNVVAKFIEVDSFEQGFIAVSKGLADCVVANQFVGSLQTIDDDIYMSSIVFNLAELHFAFSPSTPDKLIKEFDQGLAELKNQRNSIYYQAYKHWLTTRPRIAQNPLYKNLLYLSILAILLCMSAVFVFRSLLQKRTSALVLERQKYDYLAHHDPLTKLPNRLMFFENLQRNILLAQKQKQPFALVYIDLDQFKQVNDTLGHSVGDELLQVLASRLIFLSTDNVNIARLGGDEFALLVNPPVDQKTLTRLIKTIQDSINTPLKLGSETFHLSCSVGISLFPQDGDSASDLIRNADTAMYHAKDSGRDSYQFYCNEMTEKIIQRSELITDIRHAIEHNEFFMLYQPQYHLATEQLIGLEALVRWQHPSKGLIAPDAFIGLAEESDLILELGECILSMVCLQVVAWLAQGIDPGKVAINISAKQMQSESFVGSVENILQATACPTEYIEFEITESFFVHSIGYSSATLSKIRALGIEIAIDDFGTGYSALSYLKWIPANRLKIDQSFVRDLPEDNNDKAIVAAIIAFAQATNLTVIAEGIETEIQRNLLKSLNCQQGQGYLLGKPTRPDALSW